MAKEYAKDFYNSDAWKSTRNAFFSYSRGRCSRCQKEFEEGKRSLEEMNPGRIVHHKKHITPENIGDPSVTLSFDNLELLCDEHHNKHHKGGDKRYKFDKDGRIIPS